MAVPLVQSLQHDAICRDTRIDGIIPPPPGGLTDYRGAVRLALGRERRGEVTTTWASASGGVSADPLPSDPPWSGATVHVEPAPGGGTRYDQRAVYLLHGLPGRLYWGLIAPFHAIVFPSMARNILARARELRVTSPQGPR